MATAFLRPNGVISQGNWTGAATAIDETTAVDTPAGSERKPWNYYRTLVRDETYEGL